jgi:hypothetical protein
MTTWRSGSALGPLTIILSALGVALAADPTPVAQYEVLTGEGLQGSGFVIRHGDSFFGVASRHQFDGGVPATLELIDGDSVRLDKARALRQGDVQVLPVLALSTNKQFLAYSPAFSLQPGDEVIILGPAGDVVPGKLTAKGMSGGVYRSSEGPRELEARAARPLVMAGGSGGPVVHKRSGSVIGVLLTADDAERARVVGFQTLCLGVPASRSRVFPGSKAAAEQVKTGSVTRASGTDTNVSPLRFVGKWKNDDAVRGLVTTISFRGEGTFIGNLRQNGKLIGSFAGNWMLTAGILRYEYTASSGVSFPIGAKDQDRLISFTNHSFTIENTLGGRETYVRIE